MDERIACEINEFTSIIERKTYSVFANGMVSCLIKDIQGKKIDPLAAILWFQLRAETNFNRDLATKKSIRHIASEIGVSKTTAHNSLKKLERNGYLIIERVKNNLKHISSTLKVRFPKDGIAVIESEKDRVRTKGNKQLSTITSLNIAQRCTINCDDLELKNNTKNNKQIKCNNFEINRVTTKNPLSKKQKLEKIRLEINQEYQMLNKKYLLDTKNISLFQELTKKESLLKQLDLAISHETDKNASQTKETEKLNAQIFKRINRLEGISNKQELESWVKYQLSMNNIGTSKQHSINAIFSLIKQGRYRKPKGYPE